MAQIDNIAFEVERRQILLKYSTNLAAGISTLDWDADPNTVVTGNSAGETLLANVALGANYVESNGNLWFKYATPNSWRQTGGATTVASNVVTHVIPAGNTQGFYALDLTNNDNFDFTISCLHDGDKSYGKHAALFDGTQMLANEFSFLGIPFDVIVAIYEDTGDCVVEVTNNEALSMTVSIKAEAFAAL